MKNQRKGFTLIEVTLSILLISILIGITTPLVSNVVSMADLNSAHESLYNTILRAQNLSKIQSRNQQWRVCIDNTAKQYIIAAGTCSSPLYPETIKFSSNITISSTQTLDLQFTAIKGELYYDGNFSKITLSSGGVSKSIIVNKNGVIDKAATSDPSNTIATPSIVTNGLVLNLDAGNPASYPGTGTTWFDLSGNGNNGTLVNGVGYNSANGGSLVFDGNNDYVTLGNDKLKYQDNFTVETIARFPNLPNNPGSACGARHPIIYNHDYGYNLLIGSTGRVEWNIYNTISASGSPNSLSSVVGSNYFHAVGVKSGTTISLYVNGVFQSSTNLTTNAVYYVYLPFVIGGFATCGPDKFYSTGNIAKVSVYNRVLTAAEVQQNFNATKSRFGL